MIHKQRLRQWALIAFLAMIVIGFTVPGVIQFGSDVQQSPQAEQRLCQSDADCYLTCDGAPFPVLCSQNLCQQNACEEGRLYPYSTEPVTFQLAVVVDDKKEDLTLRQNTNNFFVFVDGDTIRGYAKGLSLRHILDKVQMRLQGTCLYIAQNSYCDQGEKKLRLFVDGNQTYLGENYIPKEGDDIEIVYS